MQDVGWCFYRHYKTCQITGKPHTSLSPTFMELYASENVIIQVQEVREIVSRRTVFNFGHSPISHAIGWFGDGETG